MKPKTCKYCKTKFEPFKPGQITCNWECAHNYVVKQREKAERIEAIADRKTIKLRKEKLKTRRDWIKEAQVAFNSYIRERDKNKPCICCGNPLPASAVGGGFDCGHYRSVGSAPHLRFDERNAHGQRKQCNRYGAGRHVDYRIGLISRLGVSEVEALESDNEPRNWTIDEIKDLKAYYIAKRKALTESHNG